MADGKPNQGRYGVGTPQRDLGTFRQEQRVSNAPVLAR
jgi:hypothetical protein